jgi:CRISPR system Cascade subunit CasB
MSRLNLRFTKDSREAEELVKWWKSLDDNRGERAMLRRCHSLSEVTFSPEYHRLRQSLCHLGEVDDNKLSLVAGLVVHVKPERLDESARIAEQMATGKPDGSARVSGLRFRRLLKVKDREELYAYMIRIIALLGGSSNIQSLAQGVYFWNDITRKNWAFDYYSKAPNEA